MNNKFKIIDSHAHYDDESFNDDREEVLKQITENGVIGIMNCACSYESLNTTDKLTKEHDYIYGALGIHPENAYEFKDDTLDEIKEYIKKNDKIVAIGEIGLDYYWDENPPKEVQKEAFRKQMNLAKELDMPVVIHDREAHMDTLEIMKEFPEVKGVVHCFSGSKEFAMECIKLGYYIGFTGVVTFKNAKKIVEVAKEVPLDRILVETDCPYMAPEPNRGKRNKSDYIEYIIKKIADIKEIDPYEANLKFNENFLRLIKKEK
ncbi:TatD family hydrolase [Clostridium sp. SM-530-WT-3G]|uniref:TatD family hydrolase n=1 Tax=Clostridium sp. SM-530-WT-3G TaxID=2725303 RepID=UPI00145FB91E|nr:TatD family hydrolase [Clostridium sp. SM-530-WT-3G]NME82316.1 TatD family hydrolase [Clostridium sp. SM-530-WT-3G]